jgi:hypothetical protein
MLVQILTKSTLALLYCSLAGMRPAEECVSIQHSKKKRSIANDKKVLEHFRFPEVFMKITNNSYIAVVFEELFNVIENSDFVSHNSLGLL